MIDDVICKKIEFTYQFSCKMKTLFWDTIRYLMRRR